MFKKCAFPLLRIAIRSSRFYQPNPLFPKDSHLFLSHQLFMNPTRQYHKKQSESAPVSKDIDLIIRKSLSRPEFAELEAHIANTIQSQSAQKNLHTEGIFKGYSAIVEEFESIDINVLVKELLKSSKDGHVNYTRETVRFLKSFLFYEFSKQDNISQYQEILSSKIALYIISTLAMKISDPSNLGMLELCDTHLRQLIQFALEQNDIVQKLDKTEMKKTFLIYLKNRVFFPSQTVKMVNGFIVSIIKSSKDFTEDFSFLFEAAKRITRNPTDKDIDETQLLSNETPFQPIAESSNSLPNYGEEIVQSDKSTDIIGTIQDIIREKITSNTSIMTLNDLQLCLNILSLTRLELRESMEHVIIKLQTILKSDEQIDRTSLIEIFIKIIVQVKPNTPFFREILKESLNIAYKFLDAAPLTTRECSKIYTIFRHTQTVYPPLLGRIKDKLHSNISKLNLESFLNIFFFYASLPSALNEEYMIPERELNMYIKQKFNELTFENLIDIAMASIQLGFEDKVSSIDYLPTLDHELWNKILSIMMQTKVQSLTLKEKIKFFRCLKVLSLIIDQEVFNYTLIEEKLKSLGSVRASFDFIESEFQLEVEGCLKNIGKVYEKEKMIEDLLSIDFLVPKKKVLEVNGPSHYFIVFDSDKGSYQENKSTVLKRKLLQTLNYKYYAVSFYEWFGIESTFDKENHIIYLLSRTHDVY